MRFFILLTTCLMGCIGAKAQSDWVEHTKQQGIVFSVKDLTCDFGAGAPIAYKVLKVENSTGQKAHITYTVTTHYTGHPETGEHSPENAVDLVLNAGETLTGSCMGSAPARLEILVHNPNLPDSHPFSHFSIHNLSINWIE